MNTIVTASREWAIRPADQRFWTLADLHAKTKLYAQESRVQDLALSQCKVVPAGENLLLEGPNGNQAEFQHYSFGQLCNIAEAPASYLRGLPAELASGCLNNGLARVDGTQRLMFHKNGGLHLRCVTSDSYQRIWNYEIAELAMLLEEQEGWQTPPARPCGLDNVPVRIATAEDVLKNSAHPDLGVKIGDEISPAGLYASDRDCFIFQVNDRYAVDGGDGEQLYRGVFWSNSEVGSARFKATLFLYESVCGNHICWSTKTLAEVAIRHTGEARAMFTQAMRTVSDKVQQSAHVDENRIARAKQFELGESKEEIVSLVFGKQLGLSKRECEDAYSLAERHEDEHGRNPRSAWGYAAGITRLSQGQPYQDARDRIDRAAGRTLELAF